MGVPRYATVLRDGVIKRNAPGAWYADFSVPLSLICATAAGMMSRSPSTSMSISLWK
jgi:hypothetical protein